MKKINILAVLCLALSALTLSSCLKDQDDLFEESASKRLTTYLGDVQTALVDAEYGWALSYFPDRNQSYGGYNYALRFSNDYVSAQFELADDPTEAIVSTYKLCNEDGPCIMFDTYNDYLHFFTTPSGSSGPGGYEAYDGDNLLIVMGIEDDGNTIRLKGARSGNVMYMHKLTMTTDAYLDSLLSVSDNMKYKKYTYEKVYADRQIEVNGKTITFDDTVTVNVKVTDQRVFEFSYSRYEVVDGKLSVVDYSATASGIFGLDGLRFYEPVEVLDDTFEGFDPHMNADGTYSTLGSVVKMDYILPTPAEQLVEGQWYISYSGFGAFGQAYMDSLKNISQVLAGNETLNWGLIGNSIYTDGQFAFSFNSGGYTGSMNFAYQTNTAGTLIGMMFDGSTEGNGKWYMTNAKYRYAIAPFGYGVARYFRITLDDPISPTTIVLTDLNEPTNVIKLSASYISDPLNN